MVDVEDVSIGASLGGYAQFLSGDYSFAKKSPNKKGARRSKRKDPRLSALGEGTPLIYS